MFRRAVLGLNGGPTDILVVKVGCELARDHSVELVALHVVEVDWRHDLGEEIAAAASALPPCWTWPRRWPRSTRSSCARSCSRRATSVRRWSTRPSSWTRTSVLLGLPYRKRFGGDFAIGSTIPYVFQNAPCAVIVVREPVAKSEERRAQAQTSGCRRAARPVSSPGHGGRAGRTRARVIIGCGRVGAEFAGRLFAAGHEVTVIDVSTEAFARLPGGVRRGRDPRRRHGRGRAAPRRRGRRRLPVRDDRGRQPERAHGTARGRVAQRRAMSLPR